MPHATVAPVAVVGFIAVVFFVLIFGRVSFFFFAAAPNVGVLAVFVADYFEAPLIWVSSAIRWRSINYQTGVGVISRKAPTRFGSNTCIQLHSNSFHNFNKKSVEM